MADRRRLIEPRDIVALLQAAIDAGDAEGLRSLFGEGAVLVGSAGHASDADAIGAYLDAVAAGEPFRWELAEYATFHDEPGELGFAGFGDIVQGDFRAPFRLTIFAVETDAGWRVRHFHGSIPAR